MPPTFHELITVGLLDDGRLAARQHVTDDADADDLLLATDALVNDEAAVARSLRMLRDRLRAANDDATARKATRDATLVAAETDHDRIIRLADAKGFQLVGHLLTVVLDRQAVTFEQAAAYLDGNDMGEVWDRIAGPACDRMERTVQEWATDESS